MIILRISYRLNCNEITIKKLYHSSILWYYYDMIFVSLIRQPAMISWQVFFIALMLILPGECFHKKNHLAILLSDYKERFSFVLLLSYKTRPVFFISFNKRSSTVKLVHKSNVKSKYFRINFFAFVIST